MDENDPVLDKNHYHFILVKKRENAGKAAINFKNEIQKKLSQKKLSIFIVLNGDSATSESILDLL